MYWVDVTLMPSCSKVCFVKKDNAKNDRECLESQAEKLGKVWRENGNPCQPMKKIVCFGNLPVKTKKRYMDINTTSKSTISPASVNGNAVIAMTSAGPPPAARAKSLPRRGRAKMVNVRFAESTSKARSWRSE